MSPLFPSGVRGHNEGNPWRNAVFQSWSASCRPPPKGHTKSVFLVPSSGGHFFHRNSLSPRSLVYESEFSTVEPSLDMYDENKTWFVLKKKYGLLGVSPFEIWFMVTFLILYFSVIIRFGRMAVPLGASWGSELNCRVPPRWGLRTTLLPRWASWYWMPT